MEIEDVEGEILAYNEKVKNLTGKTEENKIKKLWEFEKYIEELTLMRDVHKILKKGSEIMMTDDMEKVEKMSKLIKSKNLDTGDGDTKMVVEAKTGKDSDILANKKKILNETINKKQKVLDNFMEDKKLDTIEDLEDEKDSLSKRVERMNKENKEYEKLNRRLEELTKASDLNKILKEGSEIMETDDSTEEDVQKMIGRIESHKEPKNTTET